MDQPLSHSRWQEDPEEDHDGAEPASSSASFGFEDVCYVLFRHKWKILFFSVLGLIAAAAIYKTAPRFYRSEAKVMVKYVTEMEPVGGADEKTTQIMRGDAVVVAEMEILTSADLARRVAEVVGPEWVLAKVGGGNDLESAATLIRGWTFADRKGSVIRVIFQHPDRDVVRPVLSNLVEQYFIRHREIHQALASLDSFAQQQLQVQEELDKTEHALWDLRSTNQVFSLADAKKAAADRVARIQQALSDANIDLEMRRVALRSLQEGQTNTTQLTATEREELRDRYQAVINQLEQLRRRKLDALGLYREESPMINRLQEQITELIDQKRRLEKEDGGLLLAETPTGAGLGGMDSTGLDVFGQSGRITVLEARVGALQASLESARREEERLYDVERPMIKLERKKQLEDSRFQYFSRTLQQAQIDASFGANRALNISPLQAPSMPLLDIGSLYKRVGLAALAGIAIGVALALLMEFFVDQSVRRPVELKNVLRVPVYMSIPKALRNGRKLLVQGAHGPHLLPEGPHKAKQSFAVAEHLQPFVEALRDRVLNRFENLARKPKLVGVCGCLPGSGVTSIAAGLAAALSEAGDLKVLLVDMKRTNGTPHPLLGVRKSCNLLEALEGAKRQDALIAPNLYLATTGESGQRQMITSAPKFTRVVPRLNASDYDYIVFDMPPVNQVSITPRLAKHMDLTLLVVEAEKAHRSTVKEAGSLLLEFTPNIGLVLNKTKSYGPRQVA